MPIWITHDRAALRLAALGLRRPPGSAGWSTPARAALRQAAAQLVDAAAGDSIPQAVAAGLVLTLRDARHCITLFAPGTFWPMLPGTGGVDLSLLCLWGASRLHRAAARGRGPRCHALASAAAGAADALVAALLAWRAGGPPACHDVVATRAVDRLGGVLQLHGNFHPVGRC